MNFHDASYCDVAATEPGNLEFPVGNEIESLVHNPAKALSGQDSRDGRTGLQHYSSKMSEGLGSQVSPVVFAVTSNSTPLDSHRQSVVIPSESYQQASLNVASTLKNIKHEPMYSQTNKFMPRVDDDSLNAFISRPRKSMANAAYRVATSGVVTSAGYVSIPASASAGCVRSDNHVTLPASQPVFPLSPPCKYPC